MRSFACCSALTILNVLLGDVAMNAFSGTAILEPPMLDGEETDFSHSNFMIDRPIVEMPTFDLHNIEEALMVNHRQFNGVQMTRAEVKDAVHQYREFLCRHKAAGMPEEFEAPGFIVDRVWHTHMCETRQYAENCQEYFGEFFHHSSMTCEGPSGD